MLPFDSKHLTTEPQTRILMIEFIIQSKLAGTRERVSSGEEVAHAWRILIVPTFPTFYEPGSQAGYGPKLYESDESVAARI